MFIYFCLFVRVCPIFQVSNVTGENLDLLKMFMNLLSVRCDSHDEEPSEFQIDDTYSVPVRNHYFVAVKTATIFYETDLTKLKLSTGSRGLNDTLRLGPDILGQ